jgi:enamine deaminase RidA (YjgF/YER057c/UK114 family)
VGDVKPPNACSIVVRQFPGRLADVFAGLCRPTGLPGDAVRQAEAVYRALPEILSPYRVSLRDLERETLFMRDIARDLPAILDVRSRILAQHGDGDVLPPIAAIQQAPVDPTACFELTVSGMVPHDRGAWSVRDVAVRPACHCAGCADSAARIVRLGDQTTVHSSNLYGTGADAFEQAWNAFCGAERFLEQCGMRFGDVVRTWIHLRDIDRDYDALNRARREFFQSRGITRRPASTGVQGGPFPAAHDVALSFTAMTVAGPLDVRVMSTPSLNEAWTYGADFSRGLRLADANLTTLSISGTASIDEAGRSVHVGNFAAQAERMLHNIELLLAQQGASFGDLASAITYVKHPADASLLQALFRERGFDGFPRVVVEAPLCRPELLCETECVAMLSLTAAGA